MTWEQIELFEKWLPAVGYEGFYEVSDWGRVRSVARAGGNKRGQRGTHGKLLCPEKIWTGYLRVQLNRKHFYVHRLVMEAFIGPLPVGQEVEHVDGDRAHNSIQNLCYLSKSENINAAIRRRGNWAKWHYNTWGEKHHKSKVSNKNITEIRRLVIEGMTQRKVSELFGIGTSQVSRIVRNQSRTKG